MTLTDSAHAAVDDMDLAGAREALAQEWDAASPVTPGEVASFYRTSTALGADLDAWHREEGRRAWTDSLVYVANMVQARSAIDIGCGGGHDLLALRHEAGIDDLYGVEPNNVLRARVHDQGILCTADVKDVPIENVDLLSCFDVFEHVPDPEAFTYGFATRAKLGTTLIETCGTADIGTPLHLKENQGWHPGRALERAGWELIDVQARCRVWQRLYTEAPSRTGLLICAYRALSVPTLNSTLALVGRAGWRLTTKTGDGLISRARSVIVSRWWRETADDALLMIDDDITFNNDAAEKLMERCREGYDIVCAAYPVRTGHFMAMRQYPGRLEFGPDVPPVEIEYAATGFLAISRKVIDAMIETMPLCHAAEQWAFWPMFMPMLEMHEGQLLYLSEDWAFCSRARTLGFKIWVDPRIRIGHLSTLELNIANMRHVANAVQEEYDD